MVDTSELIFNLAGYALLVLVLVAIVVSGNRNSHKQREQNWRTAPAETWPIYERYDGMTYVSVRYADPTTGPEDPEYREALVTAEKWLGAALRGDSHG